VQAGHARHRKPIALQRNVVPVDAAVVRQHLEERVAAAQVLTHQGMAPEFVRLPVFAQHIQAGGVVDLRVHQKDRADGGVAKAARRLQRWKTPDLLEDVGRGVEKHPVAVVTADRDGRLGARPKAFASPSPRVAVGAIAVPLGESTAGRRT
jgi:hypothetical protein